jgi:hypothetical protein
MIKVLLRNSLIVVFIAACSPASHNVSNHSVANEFSANNFRRDTTLLPLADTTGTNDSLRKPLSLMDLPQTENGQIVLSEGYYEADFKSYCLQPGTPSPTDRDAYLQGPLTSYRKDIVETVLRNSLKRPDLDQRNIQLLLWSVVSGSDFRKLSWETQSTAEQLLSRKQIFELKGGVMGIVKTVSAAMPENGTASACSKLKEMFELGTNSYELFERVAVLPQSSVAKSSTLNTDQWYKQAGGYYLRYFPSGYQHVKIQVYVPQGTLGGRNPDDYLLFDPVTMMAIPAHSNSQRLGIGAPVINIVRTIIHMQKSQGTPPNPKTPPVKTKNPKQVAS